MQMVVMVARVQLVALCEEGVDRNSFGVHTVFLSPVALCEEGVDRNDDYV